MSIRECQNCEFFGVGNFCKRYPPTKAYTHAHYFLSPVVRANDWCGEFKSKEIIKEDQPFVDTETQCQTCYLSIYKCTCEWF